MAYNLIETLLIVLCFVGLVPVIFLFFAIICWFTENYEGILDRILFEKMEIDFDSFNELQKIIFTK